MCDELSSLRVDLVAVGAGVVQEEGEEEKENEVEEEVAVVTVAACETAAGGLWE